jgi:malic enzyme
VPPQYLMPMYLDAGSNNEQYLHDPLYLGMRKTRPSTDELYSFVDEFMEAVQEVFSKCCVHFEDWTGVDAVHLLQRYRDKYCVYNDDVQGTAGITLAGMINAAKLKGTKLKDEKYLFLGAGSAGIGLANLLCSALVAQGMTLKEAQSRVYMFDINGLLEATGDPQGPCRLPEAVCASARAHAGFRRRYREHQADNNHRRQHYRWRFQSKGHRENVTYQRAACNPCAIEPD